MSTLDAIAPIFLLILLGAILKRRALVPVGFWQPAERLTYVLFFPALVIATLAEADLASLAVGPMAGALVLAIVTMTAVLVLLRRPMGLDGPAFTSVLQGTIRMNTYIGLALAGALFGADGLAAAAIAVAAFMPLVNVITVVALARFGSGTRPGALGIAGQIAKNPLIVANVIGLAMNLTGLGLPPVAGPTLEILGRGALTLGLLCVGAGIDVGALRRAGLPLGFATAVKLVAMPLLAWGCCQIFGVTGIALVVGVLFAATPTATSSYILARQMGGDAPLMAGIISLQTLLATVTLPIVLLLLL